MGAAFLNKAALLDASFKAFIGCITVGLSAAGLGHFILDALWGKARPHLYAWLIWTTTNAITWYNQWTHGAGPGAWSTLTMTLLAAVIFGISAWQYIHGQATGRLTQSDQWCLVAAFVSILILFFYRTGPLSVVAATLTNIFAFTPTIQKAWRHPHSEPTLNYSLNTFRQGLVLTALNSYSFVTAFFPLALIICNGATAIAIFVRRGQSAKLQQAEV